MERRKNRDWSREEHILAFNLYCKIPFGAIHVHNPQIIALAQLLGRSVGSVSYKLANFSRLDPGLKARGIRGMPHGAKGEADVWNEFSRNPEALAFESERLLSERSGRKLEAIAEVNESELPDEGIEREYVLRARVNQHFFRAAILAAYNSCCCVTGLAIPQLLVASHIVPWAMEPAQRMNPCNGLCLNALHDRAFDRGLMVIAGDLRVRFADSVRTSTKAHPQALNWLVSFHGQQVTLPKKFLPDLGLLRKHQTLCEQRESFSQA